MTGNKMTEATNPKNEIKKSKQNELTKISPKKLQVDVNDPEIIKVENENSEIEKSLILATRGFLRSYGIRKSAAAIRDAVDTSHQIFGAREVVSALSRLGFKASFGSLKIKKLSEDFFPLIAFKKNGEAVLVTSYSGGSKVSITFPLTDQTEEVAISDFEADFSGFVVIGKELNKREKEEQSGHWFFSSFRKSKWTYVQVMIAAMVSNFLSLTTALFTMTVYDRIIPNGAFESLIALSIGVVIALGFDFLIKTLRARFIDTASKRADLEISRRLFERILSLTPTQQRQKTGAMAGTIREFETLREFFNSSTLVILIDLPFVFFFIYVRVCIEIFGNHNTNYIMTYIAPCIL